MILALFILLLAGVANGSFVLPIKYITKWQFENIWMLYILLVCIFSWTIAIISVPQLFDVYAAVGINILCWLALFGALLGIGQIGFTLALNKIGFGLTFLLNLSIGISFGYLLPLVFLSPEKILTLFGLVTFIGVVVSLIGLIYAYRAGKLRALDQTKGEGCNQSLTKENIRQHKMGLLLATIAGLATAGQNFAFSLTYQMQTTALALGVSKIGTIALVWPVFITFNLVFCSVFYLYLLVKNKSLKLYFVPSKATAKHAIFVATMAICWFGGVLLYSYATQSLGSVGPVITWPIYLMLIILMANFWGWRYGEWRGCSKKTKLHMLVGIITLIIAIAIFACGGVI